MGQSRIHGDGVIAKEEYTVLRAAGGDDIDRIEQEADAPYQGLIDYFRAPSENGGNGGDKCPPGNPDPS